jgi:hypothetical protein
MCDGDVLELYCAAEVVDFEVAATPYVARGGPAQASCSVPRGRSGCRHLVSVGFVTTTVDCSVTKWREVSGSIWEIGNRKCDKDEPAAIYTCKLSIASGSSL